jgi:hypothetical protein
MGLLNPFRDEEDAMQWYLNTHSMPVQTQQREGLLDYIPGPSSLPTKPGGPPESWDLMDDWIPYESSEPIPTGDGVDPGPFFPIDDPEPLVLFQRMTGDSWIWDYGTESHYNKLLSESTPGFVGAPGEQVVDIGPPNSSILAAMGK